MRAIVVGLVVLAAALTSPTRANAWPWHLGVHGIEKTHHWYNGPTRRESEVLDALTPSVPVHHESAAFKDAEKLDREVKHAEHDADKIEHVGHEPRLNPHDDLNGDGVETIAEYEQIEKHKSMKCEALHTEYLFRHGVNKPSELHGMYGCELWTNDAHYHATLHEPALPSARELLLDVA